MRSQDFTKNPSKIMQNCSSLTVSVAKSAKIAKVVRLLRDFLNSVIFVGFISPVNMLLFITFDMREK